MEDSMDATSLFGCTPIMEELNTNNIPTNNFNTSDDYIICEGYHCIVLSH